MNAIMGVCEASGAAQVRSGREAAGGAGRRSVRGACCFASGLFWGGGTRPAAPEGSRAGRPAPGTRRSGPASGEGHCPLPATGPIAVSAQQQPPLLPPRPPPPRRPRRPPPRRWRGRRRPLHPTSPLPPMDCWEPAARTSLGLLRAPSQRARWQPRRRRRRRRLRRRRRRRRRRHASIWPPSSAAAAADCRAPVRRWPPPPLRWPGWARLPKGRGHPADCGRTARCRCRRPEP